MKITEIYNQYKILPNLAEHQLKVAAVAGLVINGLPAINDKQEIIAACLLHDMGNILKFDFAKTKNLLNLELDLPFWEGVKEEYRSKYGADEHEASLKIARELKVSERVLELIDCVGFRTAEENLKTEDWGRKICAYADMRVAPGGVVSLDERLADLRLRYQEKARQMGNSNKREIFENCLRQIEVQIFAVLKISPSDINEFSIKNIIEELKNFEL